MGPKERVKNLKKSSAQGNAAKRRSAEIRWEVKMAEEHEEEINQLRTLLEATRNQVGRLKKEVTLLFGVKGFKKKRNFFGVEVIDRK